MRQDRMRPSADHWLNAVFAAKAARSGGVVRRSVMWVEREIGRKRFVDEVRARGFHMVECGGQFVVICNGGGLRVVC
ncbi:MAG: N-(5'-phosphoribosyl)anthranilate isomerase [Pseudomonadota bacterium]